MNLNFQTKLLLIFSVHPMVANWISRLFDLGDLSVLKNGTQKYFENSLKLMQIFQRLRGGMNRRERSHLNQMSSAVRSANTQHLVEDFESSSVREKKVSTGSSFFIFEA